jgi:hypothetical protein
MRWVVFFGGLYLNLYFLDKNSQFLFDKNLENQPLSREEARGSLLFWLYCSKLLEMPSGITRSWAFSKLYIYVQLYAITESRGLNIEERPNGFCIADERLYNSKQSLLLLPTGI